MTEKLYTVEEVAARLRVKPQTVRAWIAAGWLKAARLGRAYRITQAELYRIEMEMVENLKAVNARLRELLGEAYVTLCDSSNFLDGIVLHGNLIGSTRAETVLRNIKSNIVKIKAELGEEG